MTIGIYSICHRESGKRYIGKSINIESRFGVHKRRQQNRHLSSAFKRYGIDAFDFEILEQFDEADENILAVRELYWMDCYKSYDRKFGYNLIRTSETSVIVPAETRARQSEAWKNRPPMTEATRIKYSQSAKEKWQDPLTRERMLKAIQSPENRQKLSIAKKNLSEEGRRNIGEASRGRQKSAETRAKISAANLGRSPSEETRKRISDSLIGKPLSLDRRKKISEALRSLPSEKREKHKTVVSSPEHRAKLSAAQRNQSDETRAKRSYAAKNRSPEHKAKLLHANKNKSAETLQKLSDAAKRQHARKRILTIWVLVA